MVLKTLSVKPTELMCITWINVSAFPSHQMCAFLDSLRFLFDRVNSVTLSLREEYSTKNIDDGGGVLHRGKNSSKQELVCSWWGKNLEELIRCTLQVLPEFLMGSLRRAETINTDCKRFYSRNVLFRSNSVELCGLVSK